nr:hypothetical protein [Protofrankia symbiont of Coriaria ruscifolia]
MQDYLFSYTEFHLVTFILVHFIIYSKGPPCNDPMVPLLQANHALLEEIREINQRLIDTVVDISDEDVDPSAAAAAAAAADGGEGTIVKCSFSAVSLSPNLKSQYASAQMVGSQTFWCD